MPKSSIVLPTGRYERCYCATPGLQSWWSQCLDDYLQCPGRPSESTARRSGNCGCLLLLAQLVETKPMQAFNSKFWVELSLSFGFKFELEIFLSTSLNKNSKLKKVEIVVIVSAGAAITAVIVVVVVFILLLWWFFVLYVLLLFLPRICCCCYVMLLLFYCCCCCQSHVSRNLLYEIDGYNFILNNTFKLRTFLEQIYQLCTIVLDKGTSFN